MRGAKDYTTRSQAMRVASAWLNIQECDVYALIVDCPSRLSCKYDAHLDGLAQVLGSAKGPVGFQDKWEQKPVLLILNKMDSVDASLYRKVRTHSLSLSLSFSLTLFLSPSLSVSLTLSRDPPMTPCPMMSFGLLQSTPLLLPLRGCACLPLGLKLCRFAGLPM